MKLEYIVDNCQFPCFQCIFLFCFSSVCFCFVKPLWTAFEFEKCYKNKVELRTFFQLKKAQNLCRLSPQTLLTTLLLYVYCKWHVTAYLVYNYACEWTSEPGSPLIFPFLAAIDTYCAAILNPFPKQWFIHALRDIKSFLSTLFFSHNPSLTCTSSLSLIVWELLRLHCASCSVVLQILVF